MRSQTSHQLSDFATTHRLICSYHKDSNPSHIHNMLRSLLLATSITCFAASFSLVVVSTAVFSFANRDLEATIHCTSAFTTTDVYVTSASPMSDLRRQPHTATTTLFSVVPSSTSSSLTVAATQSPLLQSLIAPRPSKPTQCHQPVATSFFSTKP
jgi:hypothetical protein